MKKILILCDLFPPAFGPRMGYLCKYLVKAGWKPVVLTEAQNEAGFAFLADVCPVVVMPYYSRKDRLWSRLQRAFFFFLDFVFGYKDYRMYQEACKLMRLQSFDLVLCSVYRDFPLPAACKAARRFNLPLVADLRDIVEQYSGNEFIARPIPFGLEPLLAPLFRRRYIGRRNRALRQARCVTTVSPWHVDMLRRHHPVVELIYNGYDPELFYPERLPAEQFIIVYTGRMLSTAMRDPGLLFEALNRLSREGRLSPAECRVHWYVDGPSQAILAAEAAKSDVAAYMDYKGYIPANEIPAVLNRSSILLQLANKASATGPKGIMTTKIFESFAVEKPILCVRSDESYLAALINDARAGLAAVNVEEVCAFLLHYHTQWKQQGYTTVSLNHTLTASFSREKQAGQFMQLFSRLTE
jgi:glycosyltransferase involved in cell wall biosynthesis